MYVVSAVSGQHRLVWVAGRIRGSRASSSAKVVFYIHPTRMLLRPEATLTALSKVAKDLKEILEIARGFRNFFVQCPIKPHAHRCPSPV